MSGPLVRRHTDSDTKNHSRDRIRKPSRAWLSDKTRMSHHKNDRTIVLPAQLYQEHPRASWWPRPLMLAMKQRKNPNSPDQAHRESAESYSSLVLMTGNRYSQTRKNDRKPLRIFQAKVGKIPPAHDCALALADSERYDVVLLQEPWTAHTETRCLTKTHPAYDTFTPVDMWNSNDTRPRVMTYVRRDPRLLADQIRPFQTRDILWLTINGITIVNFYYQNNKSDALNILIRWPVPERCLIADDFNARYHT